MKPVALTIAGSDPSGGAGIQADLKTFHQFGVYGEAVITLLTVQNTVKVKRVECLPPELVLEQLEAVLEDIPPAAAKTGALGNEAIVSAIAEVAERFSFPLVVDPVMISKHGTPLLSERAATVLREKLLPKATLLTPNIPEAEALSGIPITGTDSLRRSAEKLKSLGAGAVLIKGGHSTGNADDILLAEDGWHEYSAERVDTPHTHGTGCTFSAAIAAGLAAGQTAPDAIRRAKSFIMSAIATNPGLGHGSGPVNHHASIDP